jgi:hypothetical protein
LYASPPFETLILFWLQPDYYKMTEYDLVVLNGLVVTDRETGEFDIGVKNGEIARIAPRGSLEGEKSKRTIDAQGGMVMVNIFGGLAYCRSLVNTSYSLVVSMLMCI